jgi:hypothetical protein
VARVCGRVRPVALEGTVRRRLLRREPRGTVVVLLGGLLHSAVAPSGRVVFENRAMERPSGSSDLVWSSNEFYASGSGSSDPLDAA